MASVFWTDESYRPWSYSGLVERAFTAVQPTLVCFIGNRQKAEDERTRTFTRREEPSRIVMQSLRLQKITSLLLFVVLVKTFARSCRRFNIKPLKGRLWRTKTSQNALGKDLSSRLGRRSEVIYSFATAMELHKGLKVIEEHELLRYLSLNLNLSLRRKPCHRFCLHPKVIGLLKTKYCVSYSVTPDAIDIGIFLANDDSKWTIWKEWQEKFFRDPLYIQ